MERHCPICGKQLRRQAIRQRRRYCSTDCYHVARRRQRANHPDDLERGMFKPTEAQIAYLCSVIREGWDEQHARRAPGPSPVAECRCSIRAEGLFNGC